MDIGPGGGPVEGGVEWSNYGYCVISQQKTKYTYHVWHVTSWAIAYGHPKQGNRQLPIIACIFKLTWHNMTWRNKSGWNLCNQKPCMLKPDQICKLATLKCCEVAYQLLFRVRFSKSGTIYWGQLVNQQHQKPLSGSTTVGDVMWWNSVLPARILKMSFEINMLSWCDRACLYPG